MAPGSHSITLVYRRFTRMNESIPEENKARNVIAFRVGLPHFEQLAERAEAAGVSVHVYARLLVIGALEQTALLNLVDSNAELTEEMRAFRRDFNAAVQPHTQQ